MESDVRSLDPGDWTGDAITYVDPRGPRAVRHRNLLRCALLLHSHLTWSAEQVALWRSSTGSTEVSARVLLEAIQLSGITLG